MKPADYYLEKKQKAEKRIEKLRKRLAVNSTLRLSSFLLVFLVLFGLAGIQIFFAIGGAVFFFGAFLYLVKRHLKLSREMKYHGEIGRISRNELDALSYDFRNFNTGEKFINHNHSYSYDLDLFGKGSVFQMLNRTITETGEMWLAKRFIEEEIDDSMICELQDATKELAEKPDYLVDFRTIGMLSGLVKEDAAAIKSFQEKPSFVSGRTGLKILSVLLPAIFIGTLILSFFNSGFTSVLTFSFIVNLSFVGFKIKRINQEHNRVSHLLKMLQKYQLLISVMEERNFDTAMLKNAQESLNVNGEKASIILKRITKLVGAFDGRLNFIAAVFLEGILVWDYHCLFAIEKWRVKFGVHLYKWLEQVALFDSLISGATFAYNNPGYAYPDLSTEKILKSHELGHPLIPSTSRINNPFELERQGDFVIVTGANMSGKSTFLRTIGVNLILAKSGLPVCASAFEFSNLKIYTSMRTSDSLSENESYFYAELKRLKGVMDKLEAGEKLFIILDEILKGTNSVDKQNGSRNALEKILTLQGTGIIATHDLALTKIAANYPERVRNQCFEIEIEAAKIFFDYKLYDGVTRKMNAMLLMEQMGIV